MIKIPVRMFRLPRPVVVSSGTMIAEDFGQPIAAFPNQEGYYVFSKTGLGRHRLAILGKAWEIDGFFARNCNGGIDNKIEESPNIYVKIEPFKPMDRFQRRLHPVNDWVMSFFDKATLMAPVSSLSESAMRGNWVHPWQPPVGDNLRRAKDAAGPLLSIGAGVSDAITRVLKLKIARAVLDPHQLVMVTFSYWRESGMFKVGQGRWHFSNSPDNGRAFDRLFGQ
jgi:hypothetical protein